MLFWSSRIEHQPPKLVVVGSNPTPPATDGTLDIWQKLLFACQTESILDTFGGPGVFLCSRYSTIFGSFLASATVNPACLGNEAIPSKPFLTKINHHGSKLLGVTSSHLLYGANARTIVESCANALPPRIRARSDIFTSSRMVSATEAQRSTKSR